MIGIYIITNEINNKVYIGQVGKGENKNFMTRFNEHIYGLNNNHYKNDHFQKSWNKYKEENFTFDILEIVEDKNLLNDREKYWIEYYESDNPEYGYNKTKGGEGGIPNEETRNKISNSLKGEKHPKYGTKNSEETRKKISNSNKGRIISEEMRQKISNTLKGSKLSEEARQKISNSNKGRKVSEETRQKIGIANSKSLKGRSLTEEHKNNIKKSRKEKNIKPSKEHMKNLRKLHTGCKRSEETKQKMREAWTIRKQNKLAKTKKEVFILPFFIKLFTLYELYCIIIL